ncbi:MAG TPA: hypothetical protein DEG71_07150 [Clostridiales bacterium]|nr:hypothetical protein [Clostridiales bacterium]
MNIIYDDLFTNKCTYTLVTTSNSFTKDGRLVMGKGAALDLKKKVVDIDRIFADLLRTRTTNNFYGFVLWAGYGIFQVKYNFKDPAALELITASTYALTKFAKSHKDWTFAMNFPGIGAGQLSIEEVMPIVSKLPDNVYLYIKE